MRHKITIAALAVVVFATTTARGDVTIARAIDLLGSVSTSAQPVDNALVIAFNLATATSIQTRTDATGSFRMPQLPGAVYRLIAVKPGFAPAIATILPTRSAQIIALQLRADRRLSREEQNQIWEVRRAIPSDILRELDIASAEAVADEAAPRFQARMLSLANIPAGHPTAPGFSHAALDLQGRVGDRWRVDLAGQLRVVDAESMPDDFEDALAESSGIVMQLRSNDDSYRFATTSSSWLYGEAPDAPQAADLSSHQFEWQRERTNLRIRYLTQQNVYPSAAFDSERFEISGTTELFASDRSDLALLVHVGQEDPLSELYGEDPLRTAAIGTRGAYHLTPGVAVRYGLHSRIDEAGSEWAPETGAEIRLARNLSLVVSAVYKLIEDGFRAERLPSTVHFHDGSQISPRARYVVGLVSTGQEGDRFSAVVSSAEIDSWVRLVFDDRFDHFWEAYFLEPGDTHTDVTMNFERLFAKKLLVGLTTTAGHTESDVPEERESSDRFYLIGNLQSTWRPSGTSVEVSYRKIDQPNPYLAPTPSGSERLNVRMSQSLNLPLDIRVLVGIDLARAENSPLLVDRPVEGSLQRRVVGGISVAF